MDDNCPRRDAGAVHPRRGSAAADLGSHRSAQDGEALEGFPIRESEAAPARLAAARRMERRNSATQGSHQRHMPIEPLKMPIPRKTKEKIGFQQVSNESREYEDLMNIVTSGYLDASSAACFTYSRPRLMNNELLEKEFVEKRREMKSDGRTDKELMESYCFLLADPVKLPGVCEKGLCVGHSKATLLGHPSKGVCLSRYSDLLQVEPLAPGARGEIIIFKVMKGKMKSIYENTKNLLDPTPCFDSHISKNAGKVASLASYRGFEHTQQYFYEYVCAELALRPRQVLPHAVVSFAFKGKDSALPAAPLAPVRGTSLSKEGGGENPQFTVWSGELVKGGKLLFQISLHSGSPPFLPHRLPEKLEIGGAMRLKQVTRGLPAELFSQQLFKDSREVEKNGYYCSLLGVSDRSRSATSVTELLQGLETEDVVLVTELNDRGFLFLVSSAQMAPPPERAESWRRCLQALFVFPESRDVVRSKPERSSSSSSSSGEASECLMPRLSHFVPALHHALIKARANPPEELSASVEQQAREYLLGLKEGKLREYPMGDYESFLNERGGTFQRRGNLDSYLRSYIRSPAFYLLSVARATQIVEAHCGPQEPPKLQRLIDLVLTCKRNAENEVIRKETAGGEMPPGRKRRLEQETAERALKFLKASQESRKCCKIPGEGKQAPASAGSQPSVFASVGLNLSDFEPSSDTSELMAKLHKLLTDLTQAAEGFTIQEVPREPCPFESLATKLGLPTNCDIDLRKQEEMEEQMGGSVSSLEGFSPSSHGWEAHHHGAAGRGGAGWLGRRDGACEDKEDEWQIPWVLIPITGLPSERYTLQDQIIPRDPRFQHLATTAGDTLATKALRRSPAPSPGGSPLLSFHTCPSPGANSPPSLSSQDPSPSATFSQCPSPDPSPPPSPPQPSPPEPSALVSTYECPSPECSPPPSPPQGPSLEPRPPAPPVLDPNKGAEAVLSAPGASREFPGQANVPAKKEASPGSASVLPTLEKTKPSALLSRPEKRAPEEQTSGLTDESVGEEAPEREVGQQKKLKKERGAGLCEKGPEEALRGPSSSPPCPLGRIDGIVEKHLGDFSAEMQLVLQRESICYSSSESPAAEHSLPHRPISQFSQYVSFYNPCPPVQDYVGSLQDNIESMLTELVNDWPGQRAAGRPGNLDAALANKVSAFVSSIRASKEDLSDGGLVAADGPPTVPASSASSSLHAPTNAAGQQPPCTTPPARLTHQSSPTSRDSREAPERTVNFSCVSDPMTEASPPPEATSSRPPTPPLGSPPATALSSLISQLQPEVFHNLKDIIKDVRRNSVQFYLHSSEPEDQVYEDIKEHLLKQGNVQQSPVTFLNQENSDSKLLVIIKNTEISGNIHTIPGLVSLKRHPSVVFVGVDSLEDIRSSTYNQLFVSGGCIISDDLVLNPDFITPEQLTGLLGLLEQHNSPECLWRWKVHYKTHKKLKEQSRFRRDAANLLDILSAYQKRQIIEFLPYHHCDMMTSQSPDVGCVMELQARYIQYRHTIFLTEHSFEKFPVYSSRGVIMAGIEEIRRDFTRLVGYRDPVNIQPDADMLASKEHILSHPSLEQQPQALCDQLVPESFSKECGATPSGTDFEHLRLAISQLRAERRAKEHQQSFQTLIPDAARLEDQAELIQDPGRQEAMEVTPVRNVVPRGDDQDSSDTSACVSKPSGTTTASTSSPVGSSSRGGKEAAFLEEADYDASHTSKQDRPRDVQTGQDQPGPGEGSLSDSSSEGTATPINATRSLFVGSDRESEGNQSVPRRQQNLQPQQRSQSDLQISSPSSLLPHPPPQLPSQAFPRGPLAGPPTSFRARFPGPSPAWHRGRRPTGNAAFLWGFQQIRRDFPDARAGYRKPAGRGRNMYRGQRGGSFSGM
eukprot:XP_011616219.1 PREDICTED: protein FAM208A-like isoform X1 [Takifugu rubripes]